MSDQRFSDNDRTGRDIPSFIEPLPPLISNPFMRPRPQKATNLLKLFEEDSECEDPDPELVQVYLRLKPCNVPSNLYEVRSDRCLITSLDTTTAGHGRRTQHNVSKMYTFSRIFGADTSQKEIFESVVKDNLRKLPDGHSFTLLTYGASGSGKTYTLMGTVASPGLVPRSLEYVFRVVEAAQQPLYKPAEGGSDKLSLAEQDYELQWVKRLRRISAPLRDKYRRMSAHLYSDMTTSNIDLSNRTRYYVWVSFVEIYNEAIYDLLAPGDKRSASKLQIREDSNGTVYVKGASQAFVRTGEEAYDVMVAGKHNLQVAATGVHAQSSRSHCIFTITMLTHTEDGVRISCVRLCDLAGCERARRTRNTGARMQESRAINSSLHVLERCLHTLRRKQRASKHALVPYRESKLTRLLGAGLSGARGEAVSMVVTLNPSPEYAHETRHVLQLAAVARDIQINNTVSEYASTLETTQETTLDVGEEVMRLRAENERLHFEIAQAQRYNKELIASMEETQAKTADTMFSLVEEAREITKKYYETRMEALSNEMEEMKEEYESRLNEVKSPTPIRNLQNKVTHLMTEIAILEEKLTAEQLARARAEEEVQHLRACIEERDENAVNEDLMSVTDSDNDDSDAEQDPCNESLEPTFKKEDINRSRLIRQSILQERQNSQDEDSVNCIEKSYDSVLEISTDTVKDSELIGSLDNTYVTGNDDESNNKIDITNVNVKLSSKTNSLNKSGDESSLITDINKKENEEVSCIDNDIEITNIDLFVNNKNIADKAIDDEKQVNIDVLKNDDKVKQMRGTYFVSESKIENKSVNNNDEEKVSVTNEIRKSGDVANMSSKQISTSDACALLLAKPTDTITSIENKQSWDAMISIDNRKTTEDNSQWKIQRKGSDELVNKIINSLKCATSSNSSLAQFEQIEQAAKEFNSDKTETQDKFCDIKLLKEKLIYFDDSKKDYQLQVSKPVEQKTYFDNISKNIEKVVDKRLTEVGNEIKQVEDYRSPSIVKEDAANDFEPSTIKRLLGESLTRQPEPQMVTEAKNIDIKKHDSIDVFESPLVATVVAKQIENIEKVRESLEKIGINAEPDPIPDIKVEQKSLEVDDDFQSVNQMISENKSQVKEEKHVFKSPKNLKLTPANIEANVTHSNDNTFDEFEKIYNNLTAPRATEFDLLVSQEITESEINEIGTQNASDDVKYNLRNKSQSKLDKSKTKDNTESKRGKPKNLDEEVLIESQAACAKQTTRRNLRLRRRKNMIDDECKEEERQMREEEKLKDIVNLQNDFSDVTIDVPAPVKVVKDIPSPEKVQNEAENLPPFMGIQSCPSKSITRSRRKLFTPRAEPLEDSSQGESGERVRVPRPSYHRPRARRKL